MHEGAVASGQIVAEYAVDPDGQAINVAWRYANPTDPQYGNVETSKSQTFQLDFHPNSLRMLDTHTFVVAGSRGDGGTVVQQWSLRRNIGGFAVPYVIADAPIGGGPPTWTWGLPTKQSVQTLYDAQHPDRDVVKAMFVNPANLRSVFLQFASSRDLYSINLVNSALTLIASPTPTPNTLHVPQLANSYDSFWVADEASLGHMFVFMQNGLHDGSPAVAPTLVLFDTNRDARIESSGTYDATAWVTAAFSFVTLY